MQSSLEQVFKDPFYKITYKMHLILTVGRLLMENGADSDRTTRYIMRTAAYMGIPAENVKRNWRPSKAARIPTRTSRPPSAPASPAAAHACSSVVTSSPSSSRRSAPSSASTHASSATSAALTTMRASPSPPSSRPPWRRSRRASSTPRRPCTPLLPAPSSSCPACR